DRARDGQPTCSCPVAAGVRAAGREPGWRLSRRGHLRRRHAQQPPGADDPDRQRLARQLRGAARREPVRRSVGARPARREERDPRAAGLHPDRLHRGRHQPHPGDLALAVHRPNGLQTGLDDPAQNVLGGALPAQVVPKLQFLLNNSVLPGGAVLSGVVLLALQPEIVGNVEVLAGVGIVVAIAFIGAAWWLRRQYLDAIYTRLRTHALSLADYQQAVGRPAPEEIAELQAHVRGGEKRMRE